MHAWVHVEPRAPDELQTLLRHSLSPAHAAPIAPSPWISAGGMHVDEQVYGGRAPKRTGQSPALTQLEVQPTPVHMPVTQVLHGISISRQTLKDPPSTQE